MSLTSCHSPLRIMVVDDDNMMRLTLERTLTNCNATGIRSPLEGVETAQQLTQTKQLGVDIAQGYYLSKPLELAALGTFFAMEHEDGT